MSPVASLVTTDRCSNVSMCLRISTKCFLFPGIAPLLYSVGNKTYYYYYITWPIEKTEAATQVVSWGPASKFISASASFLSRQPVQQRLASLSRVSQLIISAGYIASASGHSALTMSAPVSEIFLGVWEQYEISNADQLADMLGKKTLTLSIANINHWHPLGNL